MDIRILALLVLISIAGSFVEAQSPFYRIRRNGLQEYGRPSIVAFDGVSRTKRESVSTSTAESTATPKSTVTPTSASTLNTNPTKKPALARRSTANSGATTSSTPDSVSTTSTSSESSPTTEPTSKLVSTNPTTPKPESTTSSPTTASTAITEATTTSAPRKPSDSEQTSDSGSSTPKPAISSRIDPSEDGPQEANKKPESKPGANVGSAGQIPTYPSYPNFFPNFAPNFFPDFSSPYNPYGDPTLNSIPGPGNYVWTGTSNGPGNAMSFASAGAAAGGFGSTGSEPSLVSRGAFVDNTPNAGNIPDSANVPNMVMSGGYASSGGDAVFFDPNTFAFPGYNLQNFQRQMEENFRQLQNQFQQQQKAIFETANRIGADPNSNSAVSSISLGPGGGYQSGAINPAAPGIESRFAEELPPPAGNSYGVFSSSSSKTVVGPDGKPISHKTSTTGVNDNGKITFRTVQN